MNSPARYTNLIRTRRCQTCVSCGSEGHLLYRDLKDRLFTAAGSWNMSICSNPDCKTVWLDPMPIAEDLGKAYETYFTHDKHEANKKQRLGRRISQRIDRCYLTRSYGYRFSGVSAGAWTLPGLLRYIHPLRRSDLDFSVMYLPYTPGGRLLEIGCGSGQMLKFMGDIGWGAEGIDFDPLAVQNARSRGLSVRQGSLENQQFDGETFDAIIMSHLIEHVPDPVYLLRECHRILRMGGKVVIVTPNTTSWGHRDFTSSWLNLDPPRHLHLFSLTSLEALARKAGFVKVQSFTTIREINNVIMASLSIRRTGKYVWGSKQPWLLKKMAKLLGVLSSCMLRAVPSRGEEIVMILEK